MANATDDGPMFGLNKDAVDVPKEYDPEFLRHLRQPRPRDQPIDLPESFFTFDDALEDLMHAYSSGHVSDIHKLASNRLLLRYKHPQGEPLIDQMARWAMYGTFKIRRHSSMLNGPVGAVLTPTENGGNTLTWLDPTGSIMSMPNLLISQLEERARGHWPAFPTSGTTVFPRDETELAEQNASKSSTSWWPSPFDTLWSLVGGTAASGEGSGHRGLGFTSSSERLRVSTDETGTTEEKITEHKDAKGRHIRVVLERKLDPEGNVISETTRRFEDGKEKDVYDEL